MSELLELAEAYYMVARDLERNARDQLAIATRLNGYADALCEQNMRETPAAVSEPEAVKP